MRKAFLAFALASFALSPLLALGGGGMMLGARTAAWGGKRLPYDAEEYLESTGTQWINTEIRNITPQQGLRCLCQIGNPKYSQTGYSVAFGLSSDDESLLIQAFREPGALNVFANGYEDLHIGGDDGELDSAICDIRINQFNSGKIEVYVDESPHQLMLTRNFDVIPEIDMFLFCASLANSAEYISICRIYNFMLTEDDSIIKNLIPVLDLSGRPAMYDEISGQFFYNQGTGEFIIGPDKTT